MDCSLPGSSAHRIFQAGVLEWVAIAFSKYLTEWKTKVFYDPVLPLPVIYTLQISLHMGESYREGEWSAIYWAPREHWHLGNWKKMETQL